MSCTHRKSLIFRGVRSVSHGETGSHGFVRTLGRTKRRVCPDRTTDAMFAVALPQNERLGTRSFTPLRVSRLERGPPQQSISPGGDAGPPSFGRNRFVWTCANGAGRKPPALYNPGYRCGLDFNFSWLALTAGLLALVFESDVANTMNRRSIALGNLFGNGAHGDVLLASCP